MPASRTLRLGLVLVVFNVINPALDSRVTTLPSCTPEWAAIAWGILKAKLLPHL